MAAKSANLRDTVVARYPDLPVDGVMNVLACMGLDRGRDQERFLQTITKAAAGFRIPGLAGFKSLG